MPVWSYHYQSIFNMIKAKVKIEEKKLQTNININNAKKYKKKIKTLSYNERLNHSTTMLEMSQASWNSRWNCSNTGVSYLSTTRGPNYTLFSHIHAFLFCCVLLLFCCCLFEAFFVYRHVDFALSLQRFFTSSPVTRSNTTDDGSLQSC